MKKLLLLLLCWVNLSYALPFTITPADQLPTAVISGFPVQAAYTVLNNTSIQLNNLVVNTPPNVSVTSTGCGSTFNLASGASCTLNLSISGQVNANDPIPQNHLYVCLPGLKTCAGPASQLNVTLLPSPSYIYAGTTSSSGTITACNVDSESALPYNCGTATNGVTFTAPQWIRFGATGQYAYVTDAGTGMIWQCPLNTSSGALTCQATDVTGFSTPQDIAISPNGSYAYVTDSTNNTISLCSINIYTGVLSGCSPTGNGVTLNSPEGVAITPDNSAVFIANKGGNNIIGCNVNATTGALSGCAATGGSFTSPFGITITPSSIAQGVLAFITNAASNTTISSCTISGNTLSCSTISTKIWNQTKTQYDTYQFSTPHGIVFKISDASNQTPQLSQIYVAESGINNITICNYCISNCPSSLPNGTYICAPSPSVTINNMVGISFASGGSYL